MKRLSLITCLLFATLLTLQACVTVTRDLPNNALVDEDSAYVFGNFYVGSQNVYSIVLSLVGTGSQGKQYGFRFRHKEGAYLVRVHPGTYKLDKFNHVDGANNGVRESEVPKQLRSKPLQLKAGKVYYLGDWKGNVQMSSVGYATTQIEWQVDSFKRNTQSASAAFKKEYPNFSNLPIVDILAPNYSRGFAIDDPATYTSEDLELAWSHGAYDEAQTIADAMLTDPKGQYYKALFYFKGFNDHELNESKAYDWLLKSAKMRLPEALHLIALKDRERIVSGLQTSDKAELEKNLKDLMATFAITAESASLGYIPAMDHMCRFINNGLEMVQNVAIAVCKFSDRPGVRSTSETINEFDRAYIVSMLKDAETERKSAIFAIEEELYKAYLEAKEMRPAASMK